MDSNKNERFLTRVKIVHSNGMELAYIYNKESLLQIGLKQDAFEGAHFLKIGNAISIANRKYKVVNIAFKLETQLWDMESEYGVNVKSPDSPVDFNSQVSVIVENND